MKKTGQHVFLFFLFLGIFKLLFFIPFEADAKILKKHLRIGYQKSVTVLAVAKQQKLFEQALAPLGIQSVQWVEFQYGPPLLEALGSGAVDLGAVGDTPPVFAQSAGADILYLAAYPQQESAILVPDGSGIKNPAQLKGKKIAISKGSSAHNLTIIALERYGLHFDDIKPVYLTPSDSVAALVTKRVDAWTVWDPYVALSEKNHSARKLVSTVDDKFEADSFYIVNARFAKEAPEITKAIYNTLEKASNWTALNLDEVARLTSELTGVAIDVQRQVLERTTFAISPIDEIILKRQQELADRFFRLELIARPVQVSDIIWQGK